jgi:hypothetical protein
MITTKLYCAIMLGSALAWGPSLAAQVQTEVPPVVPGAKAVTVEQIKVHGKALEGNLEGDAADRDVFVFLPPSYAAEKAGVTRWSMHCTVTRSAPSSGRTRSMCRRPSKALSPKVRRR